jgi:hypothetical protein
MNSIRVGKYNEKNGFLEEVTSRLHVKGLVQLAGSSVRSLGSGGHLWEN